MTLLFLIYNISNFMIQPKRIFAWRNYSNARGAAVKATELIFILKM